MRKDKRALKRATYLAAQSQQQVAQTSGMSSLPGFDVAELTAALPSTIDYKAEAEDSMDIEEDGGRVPLQVEMAMRPKN